MKAWNHVKRIFNVILCMLLISSMSVQVMANEMLVKQDERTTTDYVLTIVDGQGYTDEIGEDLFNERRLAPGTAVTISYTGVLPEGQAFDQWVVTQGSVKLSDSANEDFCTFIMPAEDIKIEAKSIQGYKVSVKNGYTSKTYYKPGTEVSLSYNEYEISEGLAFNQWIVKKGNIELSNPNDKNFCTFVMPTEDVEIEAEVVKGYSVTVKNGSVESNYYKPGEKVELSLNDESTIPHRTFKKWKVTAGNVDLCNATSKDECSFIMPAEDVVIEPVYEDGRLLTIKDSTFNFYKGNTNYLFMHQGYIVPGTKVDFSIDTVPSNEGKVVVGWNVSSNNVEIKYQRDHKGGSFYMPDEEVTIEPIYEKGYAVSVTQHNTIEEFKHAPKEHVRLSVNDYSIPKGKVFDHWQVGTGNVALHHPNDAKNCWFEMPSEKVEVQAVYKDGYTLTKKLNGGILSLDTKKDGDQVSLLIGDVIHGKIIIGWKILHPSVKVTKDLHGNSIFVMPADHVEVEPILLNGKSLQVIGGTAGNYKYGTNADQVEFTPNDTITLSSDWQSDPSFVFDHWIVKKGNVQLSDPYSKDNCSFVMPNEEVIIEAIYKKGYQLVICGGYINETRETDGYYKAGDYVYFQYNEAEIEVNQAFDHWISSDPQVQIHKVENEMNLYYMVMPNHDSKVKASYVQDGYTITVDLNGGKYGNFTAYTNVLHKDGSTIEVPYLSNVKIPKNKELKCWLVDGKEYQPGQRLTIHKNMTMKVVWQQKEADDYYPIFDGSLTALLSKNGYYEDENLCTYIAKENDEIIVNTSAYVSVLESDVTLKKLKDGEGYSFIMPEHPVHLYAKSDTSSIIVQYDYNGGMLFDECDGWFEGTFGAFGYGHGFAQSKDGNSILTSSLAREADFTIFGDSQLPLKHPDGKEFVGWYCDGEIYQTNDAYTVTKDTTFIAVWVSQQEKEQIAELEKLATEVNLKTITLKDRTQLAHIENIYESLPYYVQKIVKPEIVQKLKDIEHTFDQLVEKSAVPVNQSITLNDRISLNVYLSIDAETIQDPQSYIEMTVQDKGVNVTKKVMLKDLPLVNNIYKASLPMNARQMNDEITIQVYTTRLDGTVVAGKASKTAIVSYADQLLEMNSEAASKVKPVVESMLNYGATAQILFGYRTDTLANANVKNKEYQTIDPSVFDRYEKELTDTLDGIDYRASNLRLESETSIRHHFVMDEASKEKYMAKEITFEVLNAQGEVEQELIPTFYGNDYAYVEIKNVFVENLDKAYTIRVMDRTGKNITLKYSALSYGKAVFSKPTTKESTRTMMRAMYVYNRNANDYKHNKK